MNTWKIDPYHSEIKFKVKHLVISTVTGHFDKFDASIFIEGDDFENAKVIFEADASSINTKNEMRDNHLKSADFFDAENHPKITFVSDSFKKESDGNYKLTGNFTMRGVTKEITLDVTYNGKALGLDGIDTTGFEISGKVNRFDYGLEWNTLTEAGGITVGSDVKIEIFAEMKLAKDASMAA
jgi:polyisoprenoid-binding protein YceI